MHKKRASGPPRTHYRACKTSKFPGGEPPGHPHTIDFVGPHFLYLPWAPPILSAVLGLPSYHRSHNKHRTRPSCGSRASCPLCCACHHCPWGDKGGCPALIVYWREEQWVYRLMLIFILTHNANRCRGSGEKKQGSASRCSFNVIPSPPFPYHSSAIRTRHSTSFVPLCTATITFFTCRYNVHNSASADLGSMKKKGCNLGSEKLCGSEHISSSMTVSPRPFLLQMAWIWHRTIWTNGKSHKMMPSAHTSCFIFHAHTSTHSNLLMKRV